MSREECHCEPKAWQAHGCPLTPFHRDCFGTLSLAKTRRIKVSTLTLPSPIEGEEIRVVISPIEGEETTIFSLPWRKGIKGRGRLYKVSTIFRVDWSICSNYAWSGWLYSDRAIHELPLQFTHTERATLKGRATLAANKLLQGS